MLWKMYFWIYAILGTLGTLIVVLYQDLLLIDIGYFILLAVSLIGLYCFVYKKQLLSKQFWMAIFWISLIVSILYTLYALAPKDNFVRYLYWINGSFGTSSKPLAIISVLLDVPLFYALYKLGYSKNTLKVKAPAKKRKR